MGWNQSDDLVVGGNGQVYAAPLGTALPTTTAGALNAAFLGLGYLSEDGVNFSVARETQDFPAWQAFDPVRTAITGRTVQATFSLQQWNEDTVPLAFGGGAITGTTPNYKYELPDPEQGLDERSVVIDIQDGSENMRFVLPRGIVVESVETQFSRGATAMLPITFKLLKPSIGKIAAIYSDSDAFAAGS